MAAASPDPVDPDGRRAGVADLVAMTRPLTARSVLASALLGARDARLPVAGLVAVAALFGISSGAVRTCLWRMVADGELTTDDSTYALAGHLLERRRRVDDATRPGHLGSRPWDGSWELAVVSLERRPAADRTALRRAATALHLAELREGVWTRPDNLDPDRLPGSRAVLDRQCVQFRDAACDIAPAAVRSLFTLDEWAHDARRLTAAMAAELAATSDDPAYRFLLSIAVMRHLQLDPLLPVALLDPDWPADDLRHTYRRFDEAFNQRLFGVQR
ncbi:PaaX family transcriptional regulator C-terminal domain-containing protein [Pseudonocardia humida]|uniref:PaaX domain-containing protein, C- domain protein n=1 Tax=Pseudonocardia humida TaxID=2800819 RepID=A0ABT0ZTQ5_9PSEU|nr:PaaX family transcriptional regulator C-terminal domain-containing protein [Pseudonocardia humida]MCO1654103.1 PaaX domain-containing protein, C- domain protein [Pseudonocardia humida]